MKILIVANESTFLHKFKSELLKMIIDSNHSIEVICDNRLNLFKNNSINFKCHDVKLTNRSLNPIDFLKVLQTYNSIIRDFRPKLVISFTAKPNILMGFLSKFHKIIQIQTITGLGSGFHNSYFTRKILMMLYALSNHHRVIRFHENLSIYDVFVQHKIMARYDQVINGSGVNLVKFPFLPKPNNQITVFAYIGRIMKDKGVFELIEAANSLFAEGFTFKLLIVGELLSNRIKETVVCSDIQFTGYLEDISGILQKIDCLIHPSHHEGMANVILEASASGRPVIASNIAGCKESILDGISGLLFEAGNTNELKKKMAEFLGYNETKRIHMGIEARAHVEKNFNRINVNQEYLKYIHLNTQDS